MTNVVSFPGTTDTIRYEPTVTEQAERVLHDLWQAAADLRQYDTDTLIAAGADDLLREARLFLDAAKGRVWLAKQKERRVALTSLTFIQQTHGGEDE